MLHSFWRFVAAAAVAVSPVSFAGPSQASDSVESVRLLEETFRAFQQTAMRVEKSRATELARWHGPIYLAFADSPGLAHARPQIDAAVASLAAIARVPVQRVAANDRRANFVVRASTQDSMGKMSCFTAIDWDASGRLTRVDLSINTANHGRLTRCVNHEVLHAFGLRDHPDTAFSVLSYKYRTQAQLTDSDHIVLSTLYDPRLPATGPIDSIGRIACGLIAERLQVSAGAAAPVCARQSAPSRPSLFARAGGQRENIGQ